MAFDEHAGLRRARARQAQEREKVSRETGGQTRIEQELTDDDVACPDALLAEESDQPLVRLPEVVNPGVGVD